MEMGSRKPRNKWNSLKMANRIPEVDLERKMTDIRRYHAQNKREHRIEESKIWDELYENDKILQESIARYPRREVEDRLTLVQKTPEEEKPLPFSEYYRQFIIFKAKAMAQIFGGKAPRRPRYKDLYAKEMAPRWNNKRNLARLLSKHQAEVDRERRASEMIATYTSKAPGESMIQTSSADNDKGTNGQTAESQDHRDDDVVERRDDSLGTSEPRILVTEPAFRLPRIADRFKTRKDRAIKKLADVAEDDWLTAFPKRDSATWFRGGEFGLNPPENRPISEESSSSSSSTDPKILNWTID